VRIVFRQLAGYGVASVCALSADMGLLWGLVTYGRMSYVGAATLSFLAGASVAYVLSIKLAFREHRLLDRRAEFFSFVAIGVVGLLVNDGIIVIATSYLAMNYLLAKGLASGFTFVCNFVLRRQMLFVKSATAQGTRNVADP
jgi:putative flippase GtrA